jgi:hypothetical protein
MPVIQEVVAYPLEEDFHHLVVFVQVDCVPLDNMVPFRNENIVDLFKCTSKSNVNRCVTSVSTAISGCTSRMIRTP